MSWLTHCFSVMFPARAALPGMPGLPALSQAAAAAGGQLLGQGLPGMPGAMNPLAGAMRMGPMGMPGMPGLPGAMQGMGLGPMGQMQGEGRYSSYYLVIGTWFWWAATFVMGCGTGTLCWCNGHGPDGLCLGCLMLCKAWGWGLMPGLLDAMQGMGLGSMGQMQSESTSCVLVMLH
jgi:hypothetical protein